MPDSAWLAAWLAAFALTQLIEAPIYAWALRAQPAAGQDNRRGWPRALAWGLTPSALTHPFVWFAFPRWMAGTPYELMVGAAELFAVLIEAAVLRALGCRNALAWSLAANAASVAIGLTLRWATGWV